MDIAILITETDISESIAVTERMVIDEITENIKEQSAVLAEILKHQGNDIINKSNDASWYRYNDYNVETAKYDTSANKIQVSICFQGSDGRRSRIGFYCMPGRVSVIKKTKILDQEITQIIDL